MWVVEFGWDACFLEYMLLKLVLLELEVPVVKVQWLKL